MDKSQTKDMAREHRPNREIKGAGPVGDNGWRLASVWEVTGYTGGDDSVGHEYVAYYEGPENWRCDIQYRIVETPGYEEGDPIQYAWGESSVVYREVDGDQEQEEYEYGEGSYLAYPTIEDAEKDARRMALQDYSFAFGNMGEMVK